MSPRLELPAAGMELAGRLEDHRWPLTRPAGDCPRPSVFDSTSYAWAAWAACVTAGLFLQSAPAEMGVGYVRLVADIGQRVRELAAEWARSGRAPIGNDGTEKTLRFFAWPSIQAGAELGLASGERALSHSVHLLAIDFIKPWLQRNVYLGEKVTLKQFSVSRNVYIPGETIRMRGNVWHWDALPNGLLKVIIYLSDVDHTRGCMLMMRHNVTGARFKMDGAKVWGMMATPVSVPREWLLEMMDRGYRPKCIAAPAGTAIAFDTNIVHRASRPARGEVRDSINFEFITEKMAKPRYRSRDIKASKAAKAAELSSLDGRLKQESERAALLARREVEAKIAANPPSQSSGGNRLQPTASFVVNGANGNTLNMPAIGMGSASNKDMYTSAKVFLQNGGRHIDTAQMYLNYDKIRTAIADTGVPREQIWITSKVNTDKTWLIRSDSRRVYVNTTAGAMASVNDALRELNTRYIDLMLIHGPWQMSHDERLAVWSGLIEAQKAGKVKAIGVSNFNREQIEELERGTGVAPAVNELELHPWVGTATLDLVHWCQSRGIGVIAYNSLGGKKNRARGAAVAKVASQQRSHRESSAKS